MPILYNFLRLLIQFLLLIVYGKYLEEIISYPFLIVAWLASFILVFILFRARIRTIPAIWVLILSPWILRVIVILFEQMNRSFLQISFDMNFFFILVPVYLFSLLSWFVLSYVKFSKYEVLINGILLFFLFQSQGNYKVTLVPNPMWLALFALAFLVLELLVLYLAISRERALKKKMISALKELTLFFLILMPLVIYLILPLWRDYEEGSVAGGGGLLKSSMFRFDFSEYIKLETEISMSDDLVLMYRKEGPAERLLLRRYVLSGYEQGRGFYRHDRDRISPPDKVPPRFHDYGEKEYKNREIVNQELFLVNIDPTAFLSLNYPVNVQPVYNWDDSSFVRIYQSEALVNTINIREIDPLTNMGDEGEHYTFIGENEAIKELALEVTEDFPGSLLKTAAIEEYFHKNFFYSLKPGVAPDGDQLSWFLSETKKGYCSYFAFSMALMCRSIGIPARVAVGFWVDPEVSVLNFYPVRADQAHAWVEVYFSDYGWIEFDPTSSTMYPGEQYPFAGFSIDEFSPLIEEILDNELVPENLAEAEEERSEESERQTLGHQITRFLSRYWYILTLVAYVFYLLIYHGSYILLFRIRKPLRIKAWCLYRDMRHKLSFERKTYRESMAHYAGRIEEIYGIPFAEITGLYQKSLYSPHFTEDDLMEMKTLRIGILNKYKEAVSPIKRIIHLAFPFIRSLHL